MPTCRVGLRKIYPRFLEHTRHARCLRHGYQSACVPADWLAGFLHHARCDLHRPPVADLEQTFERLQAVEVVAGTGGREQHRGGGRVGQVAKPRQKKVNVRAMPLVRDALDQRGSLQDVLPRIARLRTARFESVSRIGGFAIPGARASHSRR